MPDWRGHGDSGQPDSGYTFADYRSDLKALIAELDLGKPVALGHSLGGIVTMAALAKDPSLFRAVILEDAPLRTTTASSPQIDEWLRLSEMGQAEAAQVYQRQFPEWTTEDCWRRAKSITATHSGVFREIHDGVTDGSPIDWLEPLSSVQIPILLIHGDQDQGSLVDPADIVRFCSLVPNGSTARVPGAGHSLHRDQTAEFMSHVERFLSSL
jgi:pimeloyl-ACP methyl ester carboxylesterase